MKFLIAVSSLALTFTGLAQADVITAPVKLEGTMRATSEKCYVHGENPAQHIAQCRSEIEQTVKEISQHFTVLRVDKCSVNNAVTCYVGTEASGEAVSGSVYFAK